MKDADKNIVKMLKENGRLVHVGQCKHSYPFCWRSDTPLIYRAVPSWFIRVQHMQQKLLESNKQSLWYVLYCWRVTGPVVCAILLESNRPCGMCYIAGE